MAIIHKVVWLISTFTGLATACNVTIVSRSEWGAAPPNDHDHMRTPVTVAILHHTDRRQCDIKDACVAELQEMQAFHMQNQSHSDITYNFLIGGDGNVYEGRGWNVVGGHMPYWGIVSQGIGVMGNYQHTDPSPVIIETLKKFLRCAVEKNKLTADYILYGARDIIHTNSPGKKLYDVIQTWSHYNSGRPVLPTKTHGGHF